MSLLTAWLACAPPTVDPLDPVPAEGPLRVSDLWDGAGTLDTRTTVSPLVVTSPRTADGLAFYASSATGGPRSGLRISLGPVIDDWPPPVGVAFAATGLLVSDDPPELWVTSAADLTLLVGENGPLVGRPTISAIEGPDPDPDLRCALVRAAGLTVTSAPDPLGDASTTGVPLGGRFGLTPGYARAGDLTGILGEDGRLSARNPADWTGDFPGDPPLDAALSDLSDLPDGAPVTVPDLLLATPWSRDLRWAVLQDPSGRGVWLDGEGWSLWHVAEPGSIGTWTAEVRHRPDGTVLRAWTPPLLVPDLLLEPTLGAALDDGAIVAFEVTGIGSPDPLGERPTDGPLLDDRFLDLASLPQGGAASGTAAVRTPPGGEPWLAPIALDPQPD